MTTTLFIPRDSTALALGTEAVATAFAAAIKRDGLDARIVRNGSRGLFWLEPLLEVATPAGRIAYGPVNAADVPSLLAANLLAGGTHPLRRGPPEALPYLQRQQRRCLQRIGLIDPPGRAIERDADRLSARRQLRALHPWPGGARSMNDAHER